MLRFKACPIAVATVFAWDQFNRPSYEASRELTRLIELLTPARMRKRAVYWRAYSFYAGILLLIYFVLCAYGLIIAPTLGLDLPGREQAASVGALALPEPDAAGDLAPTSGYDPEAIAALPQTLSANGVATGRRTPYGSDPTIPLVISLIMVGLAPSFPLLLRIEAKIRFVAHQLSGIPTRLIGGGRKLRETPLDLGSASEGLLIPPKDWRRMKRYVEAAQVDDPATLHEDLERIFAFRSWVLQEKLPLANFATRDSLSEIETDIRKGINRLVFTLDALSGFEGMGSERAEPADPEKARTAWEAAAFDADQISADICVLSMLYVEHGVLPTEDTAASFGWGVEPAEGAADTARQKALAERKLMRHLSTAARYVGRENFAIAL